jgi:hypothetical protein
MTKFEEMGGPGKVEEPAEPEGEEPKVPEEVTELPEEEEGEEKAG